MRIRTVKPEFFRHVELFKLEKETRLPIRLAFAGLWCASDREGRFKWEPEQLKINILPMDNVDFSRVLDALATRCFIRQYRGKDGSIYGCIPSWRLHQCINNRETPSILPDITESIDDAHACPTALSRVTHASRMEGKGREGKGKIYVPPALFGDFWKCYPLKKAKAAALKAWNKINPSAEMIVLMIAAIESQIEQKQNAKGFVPSWPHAATWLNDKRWEDEPDASAEEANDPYMEPVA